MGRDISKQSFSDDDYIQFNRRIHDQLDILNKVIAKSDFGTGEIYIGAELEIYLMDEQQQVSPVNIELLALLGDEQFQAELNKYNIELNLQAVKAKGKPFSKITQEIITKFVHLNRAAAKLGARPVAIGILPTLQEQHLSNGYMTDLGRYKLIMQELSRLRGRPYHIKIDGDEPIDFHTSQLCTEGANTSFQVHLMTEKHKFADIFNAAQITLPMSLAIAANSGVFLGKCAWDETRVALFKQSIDNRIHEGSNWREPARVSFGHGWVRKGPWELFSETVNLYQPIIPQLFPAKELAGTENPELAELDLHMGTTWPWNRPVYSPAGKGHVRIEFRALPAGPTALDMAANAAFTIGMAVGLSAKIEQYLSRIPFQFAQYNFYRAAKSGLNATILWPKNYQNKPVEVPIISIIDDMLLVANDGLTTLGVDRDERDKYLQIIQQRLSVGVTGGSWAKQTLKYLRKSLSNEQACKKMLEIYYQNQLSGFPISEWEQCWR
jgi:gamma-glutamyl:cysteine ligase YbdK (ATP-grasp superfamily)